MLWHGRKGVKFKAKLMMMMMREVLTKLDRLATEHTARCSIDEAN